MSAAARASLVAAAALALLSGVAAAADNELTPEERAGGWLLLFDGKSHDGWMTSDRRESRTPRAEGLELGCLNPYRAGHYMMVYERPFADFILALDFQISPRCNSGIFVRTYSLTPRPQKDVGFNGLEVAIDDTQAAGYHDTGAIYDLVPPRRNAMRPVGEWNHAVITCDRHRIEVEINGEEVTEMDLDQWTEKERRPDGSPHKFDIAYKDHPRAGYIGLQDHGSKVLFKNIKLKPLSRERVVLDEDDPRIFSGKDLSGWQGDASVWRAEGGELVGKAAAPLREAARLTSEIRILDFRFTAEVKPPPGGCAIALDGAPGLLRGEPVLAALRAGEWNRVEVLAIGREVRTSVNGKLAATAAAPDDRQLTRLVLELPAGASGEARWRALKLVHWPQSGPPTLSAWKEGPELLGPGWEGPRGLVIDDVSDLSSLAGPEREVGVQLVKALQPAGVVACADFTYTRKEPLSIVTLRVFAFQDAAAATAWWQAKYGGESVRKSTREVPGVGDQALDVDEPNLAKRIVRAGAIVLTCHQLEKSSDAHLKVLERYLAKCPRH